MLIIFPRQKLAITPNINIRRPYVLTSIVLVQQTTYPTSRAVLFVNSDAHQAQLAATLKKHSHKAKATNYYNLINTA
ncbi:hypothetical protein [Pseudomonas oryzicola]|uniref:Uncharacterized protein n=1 Tax=Pseudomonas oryzicola TaxID=485876 RepID=A0ABS6QAD5_9PSED|nr:hypothetical protein [Pseudomonas oryzicola]MBV4491152.1 hypothetical protein [Pseudomonas oryzicola]